MAAVNTLERLTDQLNERQARAVTHPGGPLLVLAGAGSGKTRVLTRRIAWLIATGRATPETILAITFTNKAAGEMRTRVSALTRAQVPWVMTFHAACARILRANAQQADRTPAFTIYDTANSRRTLTQLLQQQASTGHTTVLNAAEAHKTISAAKNRLLNPAQWLKNTTGGDPSPAARTIHELWDGYQQRLLAADALDFDDLLSPATSCSTSTRTCASATATSSLTS